MASLGKTTGMKRDKREARIAKKRASKTRSRIRQQKADNSVIFSLEKLES